MAQPLSRNQASKRRKSDGSLTAISERSDGSSEWVDGARRQLNELCTSRGLKPVLSISRSVRGKVELSIRPRRPGNRIVLPFDWCEASWGDCYVRIRNVYSTAIQGYNLVEAANLTEARSPSGERNWESMKAAFKEWKTTADSAIKAVTWAHSYEPVISDALKLLTGKTPPLMAQPLMLACVKDWRSGSRMRKIRVRSLAQFLNYCVEQHHLPDAWAAPKNLKPLIGAEKPSEAVNQKAHAFSSDQEIIDLLGSLPDDETGRRWRDATMLMAELGLRPVELLHLKVRIDEMSGEPYWWCTYRKKGGNGATEPRRIIPLPLLSTDGELQQWNLLQRWRAVDIELPPLESGNGAADRWKTYFCRRPYWLSLKQRAQEVEDKRLTAYSFRHSFSVRGHRRHIDAGSMAMVMGHSLQTHCTFYPWAQKSSTEEAFANAHSRLVNA
ncbi:site-specific integrase [Cyanobium sp. Alchichica 3B3-8F6]|uniref:site-specific integrase n=1 Tax=Cyanobium sp. Alchichica 3B3-8F6 TaxID=2823696 RepID=UPI0020CE07D6|nr:site-specific integrase [Cyanobium sp. Alchichica 3B3-8F6]MCP9882004.1 site-specific integrase [Cyanobium sp. Alchichica 3B3-8F6]